MGLNGATQSAAEQLRDEACFGHCGFPTQEAANQRNADFVGREAESDEAIRLMFAAKKAAWVAERSAYLWEAYRVAHFGRIVPAESLKDSGFRDRFAGLFVVIDDDGWPRAWGDTPEAARAMAVGRMSGLDAEFRRQGLSGISILER